MELDIANLRVYIELDHEDIKFYIELNFVKIELKKQGHFNAWFVNYGQMPIFSLNLLPWTFKIT